jgi:hypothetical protein
VLAPNICATICHQESRGGEESHCASASSARATKHQGATSRSGGVCTTPNQTEEWADQGQFLTSEEVLMQICLPPWVALFLSPSSVWSYFIDLILFPLHVAPNRDQIKHQDLGSPVRRHAPSCATTLPPLGGPRKERGRRDHCGHRSNNGRTRLCCSVPYHPILIQS